MALPSSSRLVQYGGTLSCGFRSLICAGLLVGVTEALLPAESPADGTEIAVGGGLHVSPDIGDLSRFPTVPTVNVRVTRWLDGRWGISGNVIAGEGGGGRALDRGAHDPTGTYYRDPAYIQFLVRYRMRMRRLSGEEAGRLYLGIGVGAVGVSERGGGPSGQVSWVRVWGGHLLNMEVLGSWALTDRLSLRVGVGAVPPFLVHPVGLLAWRF